MNQLTRAAARLRAGQVASTWPGRPVWSRVLAVFAQTWLVSATVFTLLTGDIEFGIVGVLS